MLKVKVTRICGPFLLLAAIAVISSCSKKEPAQAPSPDAKPAAQPAPAPTPTPAPAPSTTPTSGSSPSGAAASSGAIQSQDANQPGVVADLTECKRGDGVLTVKVRLRNTSSQQANLGVINYDCDKYYVTAGNKKYFVLKDSEGAYLMPMGPGGCQGFSVPLAPGQAWLWWAKFPAPPAEVTKVNLLTPIMPPFEDIPITNK